VENKKIQGVGKTVYASEMKADGQVALFQNLVSCLSAYCLHYAAAFQVAVHTEAFLHSTVLLFHC